MPIRQVRPNAITHGIYHITMSNGDVWLLGNAGDPNVPVLTPFRLGENQNQRPNAVRRVTWTPVRTPDMQPDGEQVVEDVEP